MNVALMLENHAKQYNMTVNHQRPVIEGFKCCEAKMTCCAPGFWYQFIQDTKNRTRSKFTLINARLNVFSIKNTCKLIVTNPF